jgi:two-component system sensor histidine kinase RegB
MAVSVEIGDDGAGFGPDVIDRLGEPYVTTRRANVQIDGEHGGLGLGIFIAKTLLERSGAVLRLSNRKAPAKGALVSVEWPRAAFEMTRPGPPSPNGSAKDQEALLQA